MWRPSNQELKKFNKFFINSEEDFVMKESKLEEELITLTAGGAGFTVWPGRHCSPRRRLAFRPLDSC